jgi:hypothetical protein
MPLLEDGQGRTVGVASLFPTVESMNALEIIEKIQKSVARLRVTEDGSLQAPEVSQRS